MSLLKVQESRESPLTTKEIMLQCPHCLGVCYVHLPWNPTSEQRIQLISKAIEEHRVLCSAAPPEAARVYTMSYPRK